ncbi:hypothetical protein NDU88_005075 [Pleurodeles waltl]|uniref:Uncharacterized protein n=1 Tax=Pleurodeles waltl TaxID=8319 RepID=A0AAV7V4W6_PLEWA|nr:hypothetical protein NDU88_005075 [Pleurodeles waltl]
MGLVRFPGAPYPIPAIARPAKQDPLGSGTMRSTPHRGGTPAVRGPQRSRGLNQWRFQWEIQGTEGTRDDPAWHIQVRPVAPHQGRDVASAPTSSGLQWAPGPGFLRSRPRDSPIH